MQLGSAELRSRSHEFSLNLHNFSTGRVVYTSSSTLPQAKKERFDELPARSPFSMLVATPRTIGGRRGIQVQSRRFSWKPILRPCVLGFFGMTIAIVLWGLSSKLSQYHHRSCPSSRVTAARLWIEQRNGPVAATPTLRIRSHSVSRSQLLPSRSQGCPRFDPAACIPAAHRSRVQSLGSFIPSRSPPIDTFA
jgi:hypothetical protein